MSVRFLAWCWPNRDAIREAMYKRPWLPQRHPPHYPTETRRDEGGIFGPILPIIPYDNLESAIDEVNNGKRPLGLYVYSKSLEEVNKIINDTNSGGAAIDVAAMHGALPFSRIW
jgi:hypothetical protein